MFKVFFHYIRFLLTIDEPNTQTTVDEENALCKYAMNKDKAVEIGVFEGANTVKIARALNSSGRLYGIDPFFPGKIGICYSYLISKIFFKRKKVDHKIKLIKKLSSNAINDLPDNIDFFFVDGDHSYDGLLTDWNIVKAKLNVGGIVCLHDTIVPKQELHRKHGSVTFYNEVILTDRDFKHLESVYSMNVLKRVSSSE